MAPHCQPNPPIPASDTGTLTTGRGIPFAQSGVEGSQERNGVVFPPKCDTNPLTKAKHLYYIQPRLACHTP